MSGRLIQVAKPLVPSAVMGWYRSAHNGLRKRATARRAAKVPFDLPVRRLEELFPGAECVTVEFPATQILRPRNMVLPHAELLTLAVLCRHLQPRRIFEIGTYTGSGTLLMALNSPAETEITTLDLDPSTYQAGDFKPGSEFQSHPSAAKIHQVFGDSTAFDYSPYLRQMDVVLVDADHTYEFVKADSEKAFQMLRLGGVILWDDYLWEPEWPECVGVTQFVNELARSKPCYRIEGTRFAIHIDQQSRQSDG